MNTSRKVSFEASPSPPLAEGPARRPGARGDGRGRRGSVRASGTRARRRRAGRRRTSAAPRRHRRARARSGRQRVASHTRLRQPGHPRRRRNDPDRCRPSFRRRSAPSASSRISRRSPARGCSSLLEETTERVQSPASGSCARRAGEDTTGIVDHERRHRRKRVRVALEPAGGALDLCAVVRQLGTAARTEPPASENPHVGTVLPCSPRRFGVVTELTPGRALCEPPGRDARRLTEPDAARGRVVRNRAHSRGRAGRSVLRAPVRRSGVSQSALGERRILKAGEFFGEVALTMRVPRTATVTAMTPCVVASCDEATFDELVRPLFADDG